MRTRSKVALVVGVAAGIAWGVALVGRSSAKEGLEGLLERLRREGRLPTLETLRAGMPALDEDLQRRVRDWKGEPEARNEVLAYVNQGWGESAPDDAPMPSELHAWFEAFRPSARSLANLLATDGVRLSSLAWAKPEVPAPGPDAPSPLLRSTVGTSIWAMFDAAGWFVLASRADATALRSLDRLVESASPPGSSLEVHVALAIGRMRDAAYARAALRGVVDPGDLERWYAGSSSLSIALADGLRAERTLFWEPVARALLDGTTLGLRPWTKELDDPGDLWDQHVGPWLTGREDCRRFLEYHVAYEDALRTGDGRPAAAAFAAVGDVGWPFATWGGDPVGFARHQAGVVARLGALGRAARVVAILATSPAGSGLPATDAELRDRLGPRAAWMDGGPMVFGLRYERVGEDRVRLTVVPRDVLPGLPATPPGPPVRTDPSAVDPASPFSWEDDRIEARIPPR